MIQSSSSFVQSFLKQENIQQGKAINFKPGQIFRGKILQFYPNNLAHVQLGGIHLHAKLESALTAHTNYWFQVQPNDQMVELKVLQGSNSKGATGSVEIEQLLRQVGVTQSKPNQQLMQSFVNKELPFTKEAIINGAELLKGATNKEKGISTLELMVQKNFPFTSDVFRSLLAMHDEAPLSKYLIETANMIKPFSEHNSKVNELLKTITDIVGTKEGKPIQFLVGELLKKSISNDDGALLANSILKKLDILPRDLTVTQIKQSMSTMNQTLTEIQQGPNRLFEQMMKALNPEVQISRVNGMINNLVKNNGEQLFKSIKNGQSQTLASFLNKSSIMAVKNGLDSNMYNKFMNLLNNNQESKNLESIIRSSSLSSQDKQNVINSLKENFALKSLTGIERALINQINESQSQMNKVDFQSSIDVSRYLKKIISSLGLQFESNIADKNAISDQDLKTLKPLLMQTLNETLTPQVKENIEQLIFRITGTQLLSSEQNGPLQQILLQLPLQLGKHLTDLTIQWQGKKKKDGEIDPNYCRILFYLDLETLKETMVDVQVQNRVVNINIINTHEKVEGMITLFQPLLKDRLKELDYKLSAVKLVKNQIGNGQEVSNISKYNQQPYTGVDYRV